VLDPQHLLELTRKQQTLAGALKSELAKYGLDLEAALGEAFVLGCNEVEKAQRVLASAEARRNSTIRSFNDYRTMRAAKGSLIEATEATVVPAS